MRRVVLALLSFWSVTSAYCQEKIEAGVHAELKNAQSVRVLIVTRPDPEQPNGGASFSSAQTYVGQTLSGVAEHVRSIGSLPMAAAEISVDALPRLREDPNIVLVTRDIPMPPTLMDSVPFIGGDKMHDLGFSGTNEAVAVLDTGGQVDHPAFKGAIAGEACFSTDQSSIYKLKSLCPGEYEMSTVGGSAGQCPAGIAGCDHGTHVAGIIAGHDMNFSAKKFDGVAPAAKLLLVQVFTLFEDPKVCGASEKCVRSFTSDQLRALEYVFKRRKEFKIAAVNMSLGSGYFDAPCDKTSALTEIIERLRAKGIPTVVSAGNERYYDGVSEPACISSTVSVAATKKDGSLDVAYSNVAPMIDIAAPGTDIVSTVPGSGYGKKSGTSMAAPHVAAALALLRQRFPNEPVAQLEQRLTSGAPMTVDKRTGTKLPRLTLVGDTPSTGTSAPKDDGAATIPTPVLPTSGTFILKTDKPPADIKRTVEDRCTIFRCQIKSIGDGMLKLELSPNPSTALSGNPVTLDADTVNKIINDPSVIIFDNRLSAPLSSTVK